MRARVSAGTELEDLPVTLAITMPLKEWRELKAQLTDRWPSWHFSALIRSALSKVSDATTALVDGEDIQP